jgi:alpha-D-ribose 1-methylphosphonate 5-triphosphate diphosphatase
MKEVIISNAKIVLPDEVLKGTIRLKNGIIKEFNEGKTSLPNSQDWQGDYLIPGLIELHTDNMEKYFTPRPGVTWPAIPAILTHDTQMASAGVTTVFDAVSIGYNIYKSTRSQILDDVIGSIEYITDNKLSKADHFIHLRCELSCNSTSDEFDVKAKSNLLKLVSLMDHAPGQRQFAQLDKYIEYYKGKYNFSDDEMNNNIELHQKSSREFSHVHRRYIAEYCQQNGVPMASHDDATQAHVEEALDYQVKIAEFPTTLEAASFSHQNKLKVLMGAPNLVRGYSHSGNVAARELADNGYLDILSSDYYPSSLLHAAFSLADLDNGYDLPDAIRCVTANPAQAVDLDDRGRIEVGKNADILRVAKHKDLPILQEVWKDGTRVN